MFNSSDMQNTYAKKFKMILHKTVKILNIKYNVLLIEPNNNFEY